MTVKKETISSIFTDRLLSIIGFFPFLFHAFISIVVANFTYTKGNKNLNFYGALYAKSPKP